MTPLEIVGAIVAVLVAFGIAAFGLSFLIAVVTEKLDQAMWRRAEARIRQRASSMMNQHWWWDTPEKAAVWMACAEYMHDGNYPQIDDVRDKAYPRLLAEMTRLRAERPKVVS